MRYAIWCHLYNFKNIKNTHGELLLLVKLQAKTHFTFPVLKLYKTNGTELLNA